MTDIKPPTDEEASKLYQLLAVCAILIITSGAVSYAMYKKKILNQTLMNGLMVKTSLLSLF